MPVPYESGIYALSGEAEMWFGDDFSEHLTMKAGDYVYVPAGVPHLPASPNPGIPCAGVLARTDPNEQASVALRGDLDGVVPRHDER